MPAHRRGANSLSDSRLPGNLGLRSACKLLGTNDNEIGQRERVWVRCDWGAWERPDGEVV